jgi:hypothetical protein
MRPNPWAGWLRFALVMATLGLGARAAADVLPPPRPLSCGPGQVKERNHSGDHCAYRPCVTDVVCPPGMACVARSETHCDPRGAPCQSTVVARCVKTDDAPTVPRCPPGASPDRKRTLAVLARLRALAAGEDPAAELGRPLTVCYGDVREGVVQDDGAIVLQRDRSIAANAARLGHLLHHLTHVLPFDEAAVRAGGLSCPEVVKNADAAEHMAHEVESQLRRAAGLAPLAFDDLSEVYRQRCQTLRQAAKPGM